MRSEIRDKHSAKDNSKGPIREHLVKGPIRDLHSAKLKSKGPIREQRVSVRDSH